MAKNKADTAETIELNEDGNVPGAEATEADIAKNRAQMTEVRNKARPDLLLLNKTKQRKAN